MKMNRKASIIATSVAAIALSSSLIAGSTYALFTSESKVNIAVSSAKVKVSATLAEDSVYTKQLNDTEWTKGSEATYAKDVTVGSNFVKLNDFVPGDGVKFDLVVENHSDITVKYRTKLYTLADDGLFAGLDITLDDTVYDGLTAVSKWTTAQPGSASNTISVVIELPETAGNEYNAKSAEIVYEVEAVQGNALTVDDVTDENTVAVYTARDLVSIANKVNSGETRYAGKTIVLMNDIDMSGIEWIAIGESVAAYPTKSFAGTFDGNGHTISNLTSAASRATNNDEWAADGLFGAITGKIKNLTVDNAYIAGTHYVGAIAAFSSSNVGMVIENCHVTNSTLLSTPVWLGSKYDNGDKVGGIMGYCTYGDTVKNCSVENLTLKGYRDIGGIVGSALKDGNNYPIITGNTVKNVTVTADQNTNYYGKKDINAGAIVGRYNYDLDVSNTAAGVSFEYIGCAPSTIALSGNTVAIKDLSAHTAQIEVSGTGTLLLENANVNPTAVGASALKLADNANVTLKIKGECLLKGAKGGDGITVPATATLDLSGEKLTAIGNNGFEYDDANYKNTDDTSYVGKAGGGIRIDGTALIHNLASLTAEGYGKGPDKAVGIGGTTDELVITDTVIEHARGGMAYATPFTDMSYAKDEEGCPAIGTLSGGTVKLTNVTVKAAEGGAKSAAIGGVYHQGVTVIIDNCTLNNIVGGHSAAAIGGGRIDRDATYTVSVEIHDSEITAQGGYFGAGIGTGYDTYCKGKTTNIIIITGNSVIAAIGGKYAAGIGTGFHTGRLTGYIEASVNTEGTKANTVNYYKDSYTTAQDIGYGVSNPNSEMKGEEITFKIGENLITNPVAQA